MEINYIILAHKNPEQIKRLVKVLSEPWVNFYIHIDRNVEISPFKKLINQPNTFYLENEERKVGVWGDIGIVQGTIKALMKIIADQRKGFCVLLSGQDYPLQNNIKILDFLNKNHEKCFIELFEMPGIWGQNGLDRIRKYKLNKSDKRGHFTLLPTIYSRDFFSYTTIGQLNYLKKSGNLSAIRLFFKKRRFPPYLKPFGGSQWWALPIPVIELVLKYLEEHPDYLEYHKFTLLPDEIFFHSIIKNLSINSVVEIFPSLTYINWERKSGPLPVTFNSTDFQELQKASETYLFARKFDSQYDSKILDEIDAFLFK